MITTPRDNYRPFEYEWADTYCTLQQQVHWLKTEINLSSDMQDWKLNLNENEKKIIGNILKSFTQNEILVGDYWTKVPQWFPKPEIAAMAHTFASFEVIHQQSYHMLNETLGLEDYEAYKNDKAAMEKLERLLTLEPETLEDQAVSLAVFSAFTEGVSLFSSFAVLGSFGIRNLMKGLGQIIQFSVRDESLHSKGGCKIFNVLCEENPNLRKSVKQKILQAAKATFFLEESFIRECFANTDLPNLKPDNLVEFIKLRINDKLVELGYEGIYTINMEKANELSWFNSLTAGVEFADFLVTRSTNYSKNHVDFNEIIL
jgi:ribonucleoside-diphosphate reductase beta chain